MLFRSGMAVGVGAFALAIFTTLLTIAGLVVLAPVSYHLEQRAKARLRQRQRRLADKNGKTPPDSPWAWREEDGEESENGNADHH